ncbi:MAG TPA: SBBP repeat-containing protein [Candidatus Binataceae bacterium]|nr:SBBP repeat-containing protein [Candidatus Binataceae bacterium]
MRVRIAWGGIVVGLIVWFVATGMARVGVASAKRSRIDERYGTIPRYFEPNLGQTDSRVKFLSHGDGHTLFLTADGALLSIDSATNAANGADRGNGMALGLSIVGANRDARIEGVDPIHSKSNYFIGRDPKGWHANVPNFGQVRYRNVYPGVDLVFYGADRRQLEYDFIVAPGADPKSIRLRFDGARKLSFNSVGDLIVPLADGSELIHRAPLIYQERDGHRESIAGRTVMRGMDTIGFELATYDRRRPVYIDPGLVYSTFLGGSTGDFVAGIAVDSAGNAYVTGQTSSANFPTTTGAFQTVRAGAADAFITKINAGGSGLVYSTYLGGQNGGASGAAIAIDSAGFAYVTGATSDLDFPVTVGAFQPDLAGIGNVFVTKLSGDGSALVYSTYLGGNSTAGESGDYGTGIAVDSGGFAYVTGSTGSLDFPITAGAYQTVLATGDAAFVTKFNPAGTALVYSTYLGGSGDDPLDGDAAYGIAIDSSGAAYIAGQTHSALFPITADAFQWTYKATIPFGNAFAAKFTPDGSGLEYSTYLGGSGNDEVNGIAIDSAGYAYVAGQTSSADFPTTGGAFQTVLPGTGSAFVTELNPDGGGLAYSTFIGGTFKDLGEGVAVDSGGNAYVVGESLSTDFPTTVGAIQRVNNAAGLRGANAFVSKLKPDGSGLIYSTYLGGTVYDYANGVAIDSAGNAYTAGQSRSANFPVTAGAFQTTNHSIGANGTGFVAKLDLIPNTSPTPRVTPTATPTATASGQEQLSVTPASHNFGSVKANTQSKPFKIKISNSGTAKANKKLQLPIQIQPIEAAAGFPVTSNTCPMAPNNLAFNQSCVVMVACTAPSKGTIANGTMLINDSAVGSPQSVTFTCKGK